MGVDDERKAAIYIDLSKAATLKDATYWLQTIFAAGVATLGLALNSPAVIIGAMLISPLMGPILSCGLALAAGDLILGLRALLNLAVSCLVAATFSVLLVTMLPFKEMTDEIAARTLPTTLDLVVALFSGAIGSIATCKEAKGVVTSIPGVAIAVALMPPLCVVGYGVGISVSSTRADGLSIAGGGGLLFLTNLVAITFTAMLVFLSLHIDTGGVRERARLWRAEDKESRLVQRILDRLRVPDRVKAVGSLPGRFLLIGLPILLIMIPLSRSLSQIKQEIAAQQKENRYRRTVTELWQQNFATLPSGEQRADIDRLSITEEGGKLVLNLRVFTSKPYTPAEKAESTRLIASHLGVAPDALALQLIEIPTTAAQLAAKVREEKRVEPPPTVAQLQARLLEGVNSALRGFRLPAPAQYAGYHLNMTTDGSSLFTLSYVSEREIDADAQSMIADEVRARTNLADATVSLERLPSTSTAISFAQNQAALSPAAITALAQVGSLLKEHPHLDVEIVAGAAKGEAEDIAERRATVAAEHLVTRWQVDRSRIAAITGTDTTRTVTVRLKPGD
jgi:uncharacterized hydrophobic protein (TIGR00271 family)